MACNDNSSGLSELLSTKKKSKTSKLVVVRTKGRRAATTRTQIIPIFFCYDLLGENGLLSLFVSLMGKI